MKHKTTAQWNYKPAEDVNEQEDSQDTSKKKQHVLP